ncbi:unnamed protein product, partial [Brenthis ino]
MVGMCLCEQNVRCPACGTRLAAGGGAGRANRAALTTGLPRRSRPSRRSIAGPRGRRRAGGGRGCRSKSRCQLRRPASPRRLARRPPPAAAARPPPAINRPSSL